MLRQAVEAHPKAALEYQARGAAFLPGLCKALSAEVPALARAAVLDVPVGSSTATLGQIILDELSGGSVLDRHVHVSSTGERSVWRYASIGAALQAEMAASRVEDSFFQPGAYVVTGGLGGLGRHVVKLLLEECPAARVLVVGRRRMHEATEELARLGWDQDMRIVYASVQLGCDYDGLLSAIRALLGEGAERLRLRGVLHLAGSYERAPLAGLTSTDFCGATLAKVGGAVHLHQAALSLGDRPAFVHFGSLVTFFAGVGLGSYAAANDFLEWFASFQRSAHGLDARVYAWTAWSDVGISDRDRSLGLAAWLAPVTAERGIGILRALLSGCPSRSHVTIGANLHEPALGCLSSTGTVQLGEEVVFYTPSQQPSLSLCAGRSCVCLPDFPRGPSGEVNLSALASRSLDALRKGPASAASLTGSVQEDTVLRIVGEAMGTSVTLDTDIMDAGVDSVVAIELAARLNEALEASLPTMFIYTESTPRRILSSIRGEQHAPLAPGSTSENTPSASRVEGRQRCFMLHGEASDAELQESIMRGTVCCQPIVLSLPSHD